MKIIAEIGLNHEANLEYCFQMLDELEEIQDLTSHEIIPKFQIYTADTLAHPSAKKYWFNNSETSQHKLFQTQFKTYHPVFEYCEKKCLPLCASIFSIDLLKEYDYLDYYKIASGDLTYVQLLQHLQELKCITGAEIIMSTGGATNDEIKEALETVQVDYLLHCVQNYPTTMEQSNLHRIIELKKIHSCVGYSDHVLYDKNFLTYAWLLGAEVIEKHYTFDKDRPNFDHCHSMDKHDLLELCQHTERIEQYIYSNSINKLAKEQTRRSIVAKRDLPKGTILTEDDLICLRPATGGIPANRFYQILNMQTLKDISQGDILDWSDLK